MNQTTNFDVYNYTRYLNGEITEEKAKEIFGNMFPEIKGGRIMREEIDSATEEELFLTDGDYSP